VVTLIGERNIQLFRLLFTIWCNTRGEKQQQKQKNRTKQKKTTTTAAVAT